MASEPVDSVRPESDHGPETDADALRRLEQRLDRAAAAAERLLADAAVAAASGSGSGSGSGSSDAASDAPLGGSGGTSGEPGGSSDGSDGPRQPPPAGWQRPAPGGSSEPGRGWSSGETDLLLGLLASLRDRIPPELQQRLADAVREVLLALRALIDWYLERTERRRAAPTEIQDIPIL